MISVNFYTRDVTVESDIVIFSSGFNSISIDVSDITDVQIDYIMNVVRVRGTGFFCEFNFCSKREVEEVHQKLADLVTEVRE